MSIKYFIAPRGDPRRLFSAKSGKVLLPEERNYQYILMACYSGTARYF